jgi:putative transposase
VKGSAIGRKKLEEIATIARADTILGWFRELVAEKWTFPHKRRGRPRTRRDVGQLLVKMATENLTWGYTRLQGALKNLGFKVSRGTVANVLKENGIEGAPDRGARTPWKTFLKAHWEVLAASDFLTTEVWTKGGLVTYYIFFVIELKTRRVQIAGMTPNPNGPFMVQIARNLTECEGGFLKCKEILLRDRDKKYCDQFDAILRDAGIEPKPLPAQSPNLNAYAERFVLTVKSECLNRMVFFGERSLRRAVTEFMAHYHEERNHQSLDNEVIIPLKQIGEGQGPIQRKERLGGMLNYYHRLAA